MNTKVLLILIIFNNCKCYDRKFLKVENCTATGKTVVIHDCAIRDNKINVNVDVLPANRNSTKVAVRLLLSEAYSSVGCQK